MLTCTVYFKDMGMRVIPTMLTCTVYFKAMAMRVIPTMLTCTVSLKSLAGHQPLEAPQFAGFFAVCVLIMRESTTMLLHY